MKREFKEAVKRFKDKHGIKGLLKLHYFTHIKYGECYTYENYNNSCVVFLKGGEFLINPYPKSFAV